LNKLQQLFAVLFRLFLFSHRHSICASVWTK